MSDPKGHGQETENDFLDVDDGCCARCHGEGGWHDCGDDCCACLDKDEITDICPDCGGEGR